MATDCPKCGYDGQRKIEDRQKTYSILGISVLTRDYVVLVCPDCGYEDSVYTI